jgi:hypothetical protein
MKTGKITAKLRDAVPVCLMVDGVDKNGMLTGEVNPALRTALAEQSFIAAE